MTERPQCIQVEQGEQAVAVRPGAVTRVEGAY